MHELALTETLLRAALTHAEQAGARRLLAVNLSIGQLSEITPDSIQFYWEFISRGTLGEGARLNFEALPTVWRCDECEQTFVAPLEPPTCPACNSREVRPQDGDAVQLVSLDIEMEDAPAAATD